MKVLTFSQLVYVVVICNDTQSCLFLILRFVLATSYICISRQWV